MTRRLLLLLLLHIPFFSFSQREELKSSWLNVNLDQVHLSLFDSIMSEIKKVRLTDTSNNVRFSSWNSKGGNASVWKNKFYSISKYGSFLPSLSFTKIGRSELNFFEMHNLPFLHFTKCDIDSLRMNNCNIYSLSVTGKYHYIDFTKCNFGILSPKEKIFNSSKNTNLYSIKLDATFRSISISSCNFENPCGILLNMEWPLTPQNIYIRYCRFKSRLFMESSSKTSCINLEGSEFKSKVTFPYILSDTIILTNSIFEEKVDLFRPNNYRRTVLVFNSYFDFNCLIINPDRFDFFIPDAWNYTEKLTTCKNILEKFNKDKYEGDAYKDVDIMYQKIKLTHRNLEFYIWIQEKWWNFGYNKEYIFKNTLFLFYAFFLINIFLFKNLIRYIYPIENIYTEFNHSHDLGIVRRILYRLWLCLVYTFIIFFGLKLEVPKLNLKKVGLAIYVSLMYLTGLICNGFLLSYIFNK